MSATLDDFLSNVNWEVNKKNKKLLKVLREAYTCGVPAMIAKSLTDRLKDAGGYKFYLGTPPEELRLIASYIMTEFNNEPEIIIQLIPSLWKRHGREDAVLYGIILANINSDLLSENIWIFFANSLRKKEPADDIIAVCEELIKAGHKFPDIKTLEYIFNMNKVSQQYVLFITFQKYKKNIQLSEEVIELIKRCPANNDLSNRIKSRLINN
ncbi:MAG: hypothetical protein CMB56_006675 [Methanobacteriota archaeon]|nr:MAG: hypothetical protein CMB56_006675 [Euryarchaeota archaeon]